jgi:aryl-alcohol dehydrogenase-like predicted oxidoreductase
MEKRKLGNTGLEVSILSYGASSLGGHFRTVRQEECIRSVHAALDHGINFIDVSPYYGNLGAERLLGLAFRGIRRDGFILATKVGRYWNGEVKSWDYSAGRVIQSVDESLRRMDVDYIDLIQVHDVEFSDRDLVISETLPALHSLKKSGKVRHVGITGLPLEDLSYITRNAEPGMVETILSFCHYSLNDDALADHLGFYDDHGVGVINAAPISMGLLSSRGVPDWHPAAKEIVEICARAADHCRQKGEAIEKLAIQFSTGHPGIATTLVSSANPDNVVKNIRWVEDPINRELLEEVLDILKPVHRKTWKNS